MPLWEWAADAVGAALLLVLLYAVGVVVRRRVVSRSGGTFDLSFRAHPGEHDTGRGWVLGLGRYSGEVLECFRVFSLAPRPMRRLARRELEYCGQRGPRGMETAALYAGHVIIICASSAGSVELALSPDALTGFLAWLEAAPPGRYGLVH